MDYSDIWLSEEDHGEVFESVQALPEEHILADFYQSVEDFTSAFEAETKRSWEGTGESWVPSLDECMDTIFLVSEFAGKISCTDDISYRSLPKDVEVNVDAETGDDHCKFTNQIGLALCESVTVSRLFGPEVSIPDTFVSKVVVNYAEKWLILPTDVAETYDAFVRVQSHDKTTNLIDLAPIRCTLPVGTQSNDVSLSLEGKCALMARSLFYSEGTADERFNDLISIVQDVGLSLMMNGEKFPFLPNKLGGYDKPFPKKCRENIVRTAKAYRRGRYENLIYTIIARAHELVYPTDGEFRRDTFLEEIKKLYSGFQPWYNLYRRSVPTFSGKIPPEVMEFSVGSLGLDPVEDLALRRLKKEGLLFSETDLVIANEIQEMTRALVSSDSIQDFFEKKKEAERKFRSETVFSNAFRTLHNHVVESMIIDRLSEEQISFAMNLEILSSLQVKNFLRDEELFRREALDYIYLKSPLKIDFPLTRHGFSTGLSRERKLEKANQIPEGTELSSLYSWLKDGAKVSLPPQELLADDDILFEKARRVCHEQMITRSVLVPNVILVTEDRALCRRISGELGVVVIRLPTSLFNYVRDGRNNKVPVPFRPIDYVRRLSKTKERERTLLETFEDLAKGKFPQIGRTSILEDTGSKFAEDIKSVMGPGHFVERVDKRTTIFDVRREIDPRVLEEKNKALQQQLFQWPGLLHVYDNDNLLNRAEFSGNRRSSVGFSLQREKVARVGGTPLKPSERSFLGGLTPQVNLVDGDAQAKGTTKGWLGWLSRRNSKGNQPST